MQYSFTSLLLLITVTLSSSNVLPMLTEHQQQPDTLSIDGQQYDNILSNKLKFRNILNNIFYREFFNAGDEDATQKKTSKYLNTNDRDIEKEIKSISSKQENYNEKGFRKEQWHNYPRQLDRLHDYVLGNWKDNMKKNTDPDNLYLPDDEPDPSDSFDADVTNSFHLDNRYVTRLFKVTDDSKPFFIIKINPTHHKNGFKTMDTLIRYEIQPLEEELKELAAEQKVFDQSLQEMNPAIKVKRERPGILQSSSDDSSGSKKKRIFSLWSRLQSLSPKGHELPHRRHIHSFYNLPDTDGGGALTAETRAFIRPPGSPLRWG